MTPETMGPETRVEGAPSNPAAAPTTCVAGPNCGTSSVPGKSGITIGDRAAARLEKLLAERQTPEAGLRVAVKGGGCSGLSYSLSVDPKSYIYLVGTVIEYEEKLLQAGFKLTNPQVRTTCGCGESFTV